MKVYLILDLTFSDEWIGPPDLALFEVTEERIKYFKELQEKIDTFADQVESLVSIEVLGEPDAWIEIDDSTAEAIEFLDDAQESLIASYMVVHKIPDFCIASTDDRSSISVEGPSLTIHRGWFEFRGYLKNTNVEVMAEDFSVKTLEDVLERAQSHER